MQKYLLGLALLSLPAVAMCSEISTADSGDKPIDNPSYTYPELPTIVKVNFFPSHEWHDVEAELSNGHTLRYTKFHRYNSSACIHTIPVDDAFEERKNACPYWHNQMDTIYHQSINNLKKSILNTID